MNPPPTITARAAPRSAIHARILRLSGIVRTTNTPSRSMPGTGGRIARPPGESTSASYDASYARPDCTSRTAITRAAVSMAVTSWCGRTSILNRSRNS